MCIKVKCFILMAKFGNKAQDKTDVNTSPLFDLLMTKAIATVIKQFMMQVILSATSYFP